MDNRCYRIHYYINGRLVDSTHLKADSWENAFLLGRAKMRSGSAGHRQGLLKSPEDDPREIEGEEYKVTAEPDYCC